MGKGSGVIGYHYIMTLLFNFGRGPIDELVQIDVGEETVWQGSATDATPRAIDAPEVFGGETREGGIQGGFRLLMGDADQVLPAAASVSVGSSGPVRTATVPDIKALIGQPMGELRGIVSFLFDGLVTSMSPYAKEWRFRRRRSQNGWHGGTAWYPAKATICLTADGNYTAADEGGALADLDPDEYEARIAAGVGDPDTQIKAMNPAHIVYQCLTDPMWGAGEPVSSIDENSFILAANTLCAERFGLCFNWERQEDVQTFIQEVVDHIAGALYRDPSSGKWTLRLIRDDYAPEDLPVYTFASGLLSIEEEDNAATDGAINEVRVTGRDPVTGEPFEVAAQSLAALQDDDAEIVSDGREYVGLPTRSLGLRVAERDLRPHAAGLKRYRLRFDRRAWAIAPAMPIRIQAPERGIADLVLRVGDIEYGTPADPQISVRAVEDSFGFADAAFGTVVPGQAVAQSTVALPSPRTQLVEIGYRDLYRLLGQADAQSQPDTAAFIGQLALAPNGAAIRYDLASKSAGEADYRLTADQSFVPWAALASDIGPVDTAIALNPNYGIGADQVGEAILLGGADGEIVRLDAWDAGTGTMTVARGCADTVPRAHAAGSSVWAQDDPLGTDRREYAVAEVVDTLVLTRTRNDLLAIGDATVEALALEGRHALPYPPGAPTVGGADAYTLDNVTAEPAIGFVGRDRIAQADQLVGHDASGVGPEPGTTYTIRIIDAADGLTVLRTTAGLAAGTWTYDAAMQAADGDPPVVEVEIDAQRDGLDSHQAHRFTAWVQGGYGHAYGMDYGGA